MSKIKSILSIIVHALYGAVCIQFTHVSYDVCEIMCTFFLLTSPNRKYDPFAIING